MMLRGVFAVLLSLLAIVPAAAKDLRLEEFFLGRTTATASFTAITGLQRDFTVKLHGSWDGKTLVLHEDFFFDDGETDTKTWRFTKSGWNTYRGTREDVIGDTLVTVKGNKAWFNYLIDLDEGPDRNIVRFYDTLTLSEDGRTLLNTAKVFKGPVPVARVTVNFSR
ncbi:MAG: DUF3833 domain-containing protein [Okeania sp. SIO3C4]|nr:DUF3833 domain-containing protein [Okeania sp. SIO3C4]